MTSRPDKIIAILDDLIGFDTTSRVSNLQLIEYIEAMLASFGVSSELTFDDSGAKANLYATLGNRQVQGVVLSGHTDVVPVDGQSWATDPFVLSRKDDRLYGRGCCDMKGFIAVCLANVADILAADLPVPIHLAFSYDEEVGCLGVRELIKALQQKPRLPMACIIGEPTNMQVIRAHKGMYYHRCRLHGKSAHSSLTHRGVNALSAAAKLIHHIDKLADKFAKYGAVDAGFEPPYTTLHVGVVHGGTVNNIIPDQCEFEYEIRNIPSDDVREIHRQITQYAQSKLLGKSSKRDDPLRIEWQTLADFPAMSNEENDPLNQLMKQLVEQTAPSGKVSYGTEGGLFKAADIPTIICGPGSIEQAHRADEYIEVDQLNVCDRWLKRLIEHYSR